MLLPLLIVGGVLLVCVLALVVELRAARRLPDDVSWADDAPLVESRRSRL